MSRQWYDNTTAVRETVSNKGLAGLNKVVVSRQVAGALGTLNELVLMGRLFSNRFGELGLIKWKNPEVQKIVSRSHPELVMSTTKWKNYLQSLRVDQPWVITYCFNLPPDRSVCNVCCEEWTLHNCLLAKEYRTCQAIPLDAWVGRTLADVLKILRDEKLTQVVAQSERTITNQKWAQRDCHPRYPGIKVKKGWIPIEDLYGYTVENGDVGNFKISYFRHASCHTKCLDHRGHEVID